MRWRPARLQANGRWSARKWAALQWPRNILPDDTAPAGLVYVVQDYRTGASSSRSRLPRIPYHRLVHLH